MIVKIVFGILLILTLYFAFIFFKDFVKNSKGGNLEEISFWKAGAVGL